MTTGLKKRYIPFASLVTILTIGYYSWMVPAWINLDDTKKSSENRTSSKKIYSDDEFDLDNLPEIEFEGEDLPNYAFYIKKPVYRCDSVLKINTSKDAGYVVKVVDIIDGEVMMQCYLPPGVSQEIEIPAGTYEVRYTSGNRWFGNKEMFGARGRYAKADRVFTFTRGSGYELTLYSVINGNLKSRTMKREDF